MVEDIADDEDSAGASSSGVATPILNISSGTMKLLLAFDELLATADGIPMVRSRQMRPVCAMLELYVLVKKQQTARASGTHSGVLATASTVELVEMIKAANFLEHFEALDTCLVELGARFVGLDARALNTILETSMLDPVHPGYHCIERVGSGGGGAAAVRVTASSPSMEDASNGAVADLAEDTAGQETGQCCTTRDGVKCVLSSELLQYSRVLRAIMDSPYVLQMPPNLAASFLNSGKKRGSAVPQETLAAAVASLCDYEAALGSVLRDVLGVLDEVYLPFDLTADILARCNSFCAHHPPEAVLLHENPTEEQQLEMRTNPLAGWNKEFVQEPIGTLLQLVMAANMLDLPFMLDVTSKAIAEMIRGKSPDEIKKIFGVEGEFTQEEKEQVLEDNPWLEDPGEENGAAAEAAAAAE